MVYNISLCWSIVIVYYRVKEKLYVFIYYIPALVDIYLAVWSLYFRIELSYYGDLLTVYRLSIAIPLDYYCTGVKELFGRLGNSIQGIGKTCNQISKVYSIDGPNWAFSLIYYQRVRVLTRRYFIFNSNR